MVHEKMNEKLPPLKKRKLTKKSQEKKYAIKINLQSWNDWKFKIHWNKLEWINQKIRIEGKNPFFVSYT